VTQATQLAQTQGLRPPSDSSSSLAPFVDALYADGITALQGAFSREWVEQLRNFHDSLPPLVREHLLCRVVDTLVPVAQKHSIEGLVMAGAR
jgi:hypothetical protein